MKHFLPHRVILLKYELIECLDAKPHTTEVLYLLSYLTEHCPYYISDREIQAILPYTTDKEEKIRINALIMLGFYVMGAPGLLSSYVEHMADQLTHPHPQGVRDTILYFLSEIHSQNEYFSIPTISSLLFAGESIKEQEERDLIHSLLQSQKFLLLSQYNKVNEFQNSRKFDISEYIKYFDLTLSEFFKIYRKYYDKSSIISIFVKTRYNFHWILFEFNKEFLRTTFQQDSKIPFDHIRDFFSEIIDIHSKPLIRFFMRNLIQQQILDGYFSLTGYYYSFRYLTSKVRKELSTKGHINVANYRHFPREFFMNALQEGGVRKELLWEKDGSHLYEMSEFYNHIEQQVQSTSCIDLTKYNTRLKEQDFHQLLKKISADHLILDQYHYKNTYLTNSGKNKILQEYENAQNIGYMNIKIISHRLHIPLALVIALLYDHVDARSGLLSKDGMIFYFNTYLLRKSLSHGISKVAYVVAKRLGYLTKKVKYYMNENQIHFIRKIMQHDEISLAKYCEKLGLPEEDFLSLLDTMKVSYLKQGDRILFKSGRIEEEKEEVKQKIIETAQKKDTFTINTRQFNIPELFLYDILHDLQKELLLEGIIYRKDNTYHFVSKEALKELLLENTYKFKIRELYPEKQFTPAETKLIHSIVQELIEKEKLIGTYSEENMEFISDELKNADKYEDMIHAATRKTTQIIDHYTQILNEIKDILVNTKERIAPIQITTIQELIEWVISKQKHWGDELDSFITQQSMEIKQNLSEHAHIQTLLNKILHYRALFNKLSVNYNSIIYYQRLYLTKPEDPKGKENYFRLLRDHHLIE